MGSGVWARSIGGDGGVALLPRTTEGPPLLPPPLLDADKFSVSLPHLNPLLARGPTVGACSLRARPSGRSWLDKAKAPQCCRYCCTHEMMLRYREIELWEGDPTLWQLQGKTARDRAGELRPDSAPAPACPANYHLIHPASLPAESSCVGKLQIDRRLLLPRVQAGCWRRLVLDYKRTSKIRKALSMRAETRGMRHCHYGHR